MNTNGGIDRNIPNDNYVETQVKNIKQNLARQGPNKSFASAQIVCKTTQTLHDIREGLQAGCNQYKKTSKHSKVDKSVDVLEMAQTVCKAGLIENPGQELDGFENFTEPLKTVKPMKLHAWIKEQKKTAGVYMKQ